METTKNKASVRKRTVNLLVHILLAVLAFIWIMPIVWILLTSFRAEPGSYVTTFFPKGYTIANYIKLFTDRNVLNFPKMFKNTFIIAVICCLISTYFVLAVSYSLSRMRFPFRKPYMNIAMILGLFPGFMAMIAQYYILKTMGLTEGHMIRIALIVVYSACTGLGFQIAKGFFDTIPKSLDEGATLDGASRHTIFWKIILPNSKPIVVNTAINAFIAPWVDFIFVSVIMKDNYNNYTVAKGLYTMVDKANIYQYYTVFCAGSVVVAIPIVLLFIRLQKYYVAGVTGGATKG